MNKILFFIDIRNRYLADDFKNQGGEGTEIILILLKITIAQHFISNFMIIFRKSGQLLEKLQQLKNEGKKSGFVPTMGALHDGHISLVEQSRKLCDITICSIFVNPAQFNDPADFEKYPITIESDIHQLYKAKTDILFLPPVNEIYPEGLANGPSYDLGFLETILEGYYRPGHFQGVCRVMHRLLTICQPDELFMGQKDYQQCMVVKKLLTDYDLGSTLNIVPTKRESNGLAMSSRNLRLSDPARTKASAIYSALTHIKDNFCSTPLNQLKQQALVMIESAGFDKVDYLDICNAGDLTPATPDQTFDHNVALAAAFIEGVRLIDNLAIN